MRRNNLIRVPSDEVQGEGSFVTLRRPTWKTMRAVMKAQMGSGESDAEIGVEALEVAFPNMIVAWNWAKEDVMIDEYGKEMIVARALALPSQDADVLEELDFEEIMFLIQHVTPLLGALGNRKN